MAGTIALNLISSDRSNTNLPEPLPLEEKKKQPPLHCFYYHRL
jgi:hypothetical protein